MKNKILKKISTLILSVILLFVGLTIIGEVAPNTFDNINTANAIQLGEGVNLNNFNLDNIKIVETAHAQTDNSIGSSDEAKALYNRMVSVLVIAIEFLSALLWPVLLLIGSLLKNDILFSGGMEATMLNIWVNVRNLVNILFILVLLGIAFYNVVGGSAEDYQIKSILPKFIVALIAVNFSFLGVRLVADTVNVFTIAIFALPNTVQTELQALSEEGMPNKVCTEWAKRQKFIDSNPVGTVQSDPQTPPKDSSGIINFENICKKNGETFEYTETGKQFFNTFSANNAALVMAIDMGKILNIDKVKLTSTSSDPIKDLTINILLTVVLYIAYASGFLALFLILVVRMVLLWVTAVLSPLIVLRYVLPESIKSSLGGGGDLQEKLIKSIIAPVPIALMMTIGFIMFQSLKVTSFLNSPLGAETAEFNLLTSGLSTLQDLIIAVGMVVVVWMGVFAAASGTFAEKAVDGLKGMVEGAGKFVATAPFKYLPIIPVRVGEKDENISAGMALGAIQQVPREMETDQFGDTRKIARQIAGLPDAETLDLKGAKEISDIANRFKKAGVPTDAASQNKLYLHLKGDPGLANKMAAAMQLKNGKELMDLLEQGKVDQSSFGQFMRKNATVANAKPGVAPYQNFNPGSGNPGDKAINEAFDTATQQKISTKSASEDEQAKIGTAIAELHGKWSEGSRASVNDLDNFVNSSKTSIQEILKTAGVPESQLEAKANGLLISLLEDRLKKATTDEEKTKIQSVINKLKGGSTNPTPQTPPTPPAASPETPTETPPPSET